MRALTLMALGIVLAWPQLTTVPRAAGCDPVGEIRFVCNQAGPEDLVAVPGSSWLVASAYGAEGGLNLIDTKAASSTRLFPSATAQPIHVTTGCFCRASSSKTSTDSRLP